MDDLNQIDVVHMNWDNYQPGDHQTIKKIIKGNINSVCANYVAIGYYLDNIAERKLYQEDGYSGIGEYAEAEYGIKKDKCSYLIKIAKKFCIPNSPALLPEYREFKIEKLREMVYLTDDQLEQVTLTTTRAEIRDMKNPVPEKVAPAQLESEQLFVKNHDKAKGILNHLMSEKWCALVTWRKFLEADIVKKGKEVACKDFLSFHGGQGQSLKAENGHPKFEFILHRSYADRTAKIEISWDNDKAEMPTDEFIDLFLKYSVHDESKQEETLPLSPVENTNLTEQDTIDFTRSIDNLANEYEAKGSCPQGIGGCMRNGEEGETGKKICLKCWKEWLSREKILVEAKALKEQEPQENVNDTQNTATDNTDSMDNKADILERACSNCKYNIMPREDYFKEYPDTDEFPCDNCNGDLNNWRPDIGIVNQEVDSAAEQEPENSPSEFPCDTCGHEKSTGCCDYDSEDDYCVLGDKWKPKNPEEPEIVEADVIHTETDNSDPERYSLTDLDAEIRFLTANLTTMRKENIESPARYKTKMRLDAATALLDKLKEPVTEDENIVKKMVRYAMGWFDKGDYSNTDFYLFNARKDLSDNYDYDRRFNPDFINDNRRPQPELPVLKNNDQRKEWIDNYITWPVWIDIPHTGEKYYRYDLTNKVAIVVKVRRKHAYAGYKETKDYEYGAEQYYLLGIKSEWSQKGTKIVVDETRTFYECNTNKSALVDYLKDYQKKG